MADFNVSYKITSKHEGGYANNPNDPGGETYAGIARKFHPNWAGWKIIDGYKLSGPIAWNTRFKNVQLESLVKDYYFQNFWKAQARGHELTNQEVANFIYDFVVNSGDAEDQIDKAINKAIGTATGQKVNVTNNRLDDLSVRLLNSSPSLIYPHLIQARIDYVKSLEAYKYFGKTWMDRILSFPKSIIEFVTDPSKKKS